MFCQVSCQRCLQPNCSWWFHVCLGCFQATVICIDGVCECLITLTSSVWKITFLSVAFSSSVTVALILYCTELKYL